MSIISQLNTANTFSQWLTGTQDVISKVNELVEGGSSFTFYSNTNFAVANNLTIGGDLTVSGNIILDSIGYDDINANGSITAANNLTVGQQTTLNVATVTGNTTLNNAYITYSNQQTANVVRMVGAANTAVYANVASAYSRASDDAVAFSIALG